MFFASHTSDTAEEDLFSNWIVHLWWDSWYWV